MNKEDVLNISRKENKGRYDEREMLAFYRASRVGMLVGGALCVILILVSEFILKMPQIALVGWMVYFAMQGSADIVLYVRLKTGWKLTCGIAEIVFAAAFAVLLMTGTVV